MKVNFKPCDKLITNCLNAFAFAAMAFLALDFSLCLTLFLSSCLGLCVLHFVLGFGTLDFGDLWHGFGILCVALCAWLY